MVARNEFGWLTVTRSMRFRVGEGFAIRKVPVVPRKNVPVSEYDEF